MFARFVRRLGAAMALAVSTLVAGAPLSVLQSVGPAAPSPQHGFFSAAQPVSLEKRALAAMHSGDELSFSLPAGGQHTFVLDLVEDHGGGIVSYVGHSKTHGNDYRLVLTTGSTGSFASIRTPEGEFRLVPGDGHDWLIDMAAEQPFHSPIMLDQDTRHSPATKELVSSQNAPDVQAAVAGINAPFVGKAAPTGQYGVDVMFVVTQGLAGHLGSNLMTRLYQLVASANTAYADSEVSLKMRLVGVTTVNYTDGGSDGNALDDVTPACTATNFCGRAFDVATFGNIETQRAAVGADFVAVMRDGSSFGGSGIAWIGQFSGVTSATDISNATQLNAASLTNPTFMYSVTTGCVLGCDVVFVHEVGHNMGDYHDRDTSLWQAGGNAANAFGDPLGYAYGYAHCDGGPSPTGLTCNPALASGAGSCTSQPECNSPATGTNNISEIMAYFHVSTTKPLKFSNPNVTCTGNLGTALACGQAGSANAALAMNQRRGALSKIKGTVQSPAPAALTSVQFTANSFTVAESAGSVNVTVSRLGNSTGVVSVQYATANGTATSGSDYAAGSGTLTWADGDSANKSILIPITNDAIIEGNESFTVTLSNPTGAFLGLPTTATVTIAEPWPPGGTMPTAFTNSSGPAWAVANDTSNDGDGVSLKSGAIFNCPPICSFATVPGATTLQYAATFIAGTVSFAYKVNSYPSNGFFEFLVDGAVVKSDSGDSGWVSFSRAITAGAHTLQWRYRPVLSFACNNIDPNSATAPPQGFVNCADRAWIDSVALPLQPTGPFALNVAVTGSGLGAVSSSPPGVSCGVDCTETYASGTVVTLTANPTTGSVFSGWSGGGCLGTGTCVVTMNAATNVTARFDTPANAPRLTGISTRAQVLTGDNVMIAGFIVAGSKPKTVAIRARGPSLGIVGAMADPTLTLVPADGSAATFNDNWGTLGNVAALIAVGFQPSDPRESAIVATLNPGAYTAVVSGAGNRAGVAIVEVFEIDTPEVPMTGISTRTFVQTGDNVMIGGFIISGASPQTVVVRARGPSTGVAGALLDPTLTIVPADGSPALSNDNWGTDPSAALLSARGFAPGDSRESAMLVTLPPGAYTAIVSGAGGTTGVAIVEVFSQ